MGSSRNVRLDLAYRGTDYHGFAENDGVDTVGGALRTALETVLREEIELMVAGRTDAGVHASHQVVSFRTTSDRFDAERLAGSVSKLCAPDIVVRSVVEVPPDFDARFSAVSRRYEYTVNDGPHPDPLRAATEWWVGEPLALSAMNDAASALVGEHDFSSFCRRPKDRPDASLVRHVSRADWHRIEPTRLMFTVEANAFCHQMVRSLVGFCVSVGRGRRSADEVEAVLAACDRDAAGAVAPPLGLVLVDVSYTTAGDSA